MAAPPLTTIWRTGGVVRTFCASVVLPLLVGGLLYIGLRSPQLVLFRWVELLGLVRVVAAWRSVLAPLAPVVPEWVVFSLPDALWTYALAWSLARVWRDSPRALLIGALTVPVLAGPGYELAQWVGWIPGTFDPVDVLLTSCACLVGAVLGVRSRTRSKERDQS